MVTALIDEQSEVSEGFALDPSLIDEQSEVSEGFALDPYVLFYGRYFSQQDYFRVDPQHVNSQSTESLQYWESVLSLCIDSTRIYPADEGGRDVFALGTVIIKSSHMHSPVDGKPVEIDYSYADANEVEAVTLARTVLKDVKVPDIYFSGKINGRQALVQERLPGVSLTVAWPYLAQDRKDNFKQQAREVLRQLHGVKPTDGRQAHSHIVAEPNILTNGRIHALEGNLLFSKTEDDPDLGFMHNDFTESNCIVDNDKITGLVDWEMAGFFGWKMAGEVHRKIRTSQREHFVNTNVSESKLREIMFWQDLYDGVCQGLHSEYEHEGNDAF